MTADDERAIDRYLNEVCWAMGGRFAEQQAARDELQAHIRDAVADLELQGAGRADATARALAALGAAETVGRSLRASRGRAPLRRGVLQPAGAALIERRRGYRLPPLRLALALAASGVASGALALIYLWPA